MSSNRGWAWDSAARDIPLVIALMACALFVMSVNTYQTNDSTITLETSHVAVLEPHRHSANDSATDPTHHVTVLSNIYVVPKDTWISKIAFDILNAPDTTVHHVRLVNLSEPSQNCLPVQYAHMFGLGQDGMHDSTLSFPSGTGMRVKRGSRIQLSLMVHNPLPPIGPGETYADVYGRLILSLQDNRAPADLKEIHPRLLHLGDDPCDPTDPNGMDAYEFAVPAHTINYTKMGTGTSDDPGTLVFKKPSTIVYVGGHLHGWQGGKKVIVEKNEMPFLEFNTAPSKTYPYRYDTESSNARYEMQTGDTLRIRAIYDNPDETHIRGAMGGLGIYYFEQ